MDEPEAGIHRYDLFTHDGSRRIVTRFADAGIAVEPDAIALLRGGRWTRAAFSDILSITLNSAVIGRATIAQCIIQLGNGGKIVTSNANATGLVDGLRNGDFRNFVEALHAQLIKSGAAKSIAFHAGYSSGRMSVLTVALVAGGALFVVAPLVLLVITGQIKALGLTIAGAFLLWPALKMVRANQPGSYSPERPPNLIL